ncbi:putative lipid II flippase FtsW [bacterium]|nr:MAG: putative lipid II flippase FtsW [bacterium]
MFWKFSRSSAPDYLFIAFLLIIVVFGLVMLTSASSDLSQSKFGDSFYYLKHQVLYGLLPGIVGFLFALFFNYQGWKKWGLPLLILGIVSLLLVFTPLGFNAFGSDRWLNIGGFGFQPGEFVKVAFLIYMAAWLSKNQTRGRSFMGGLVPFLILLGSVLIPLIFQPATTTAVLILVAAISMYFTAGAKVRFIVLIALVGALAVILLVLVTPYRMQRVLSFLDPASDPLGKTYQINQSLLAIGSGGIWGVGYGRSTTKLNYLPEPMGDSIFPVIAEELGFAGSLALVSFFLIFVWRGLIIAKSAPDIFGRLLGTGFITLIGLQAFVHIGANSGLIPLTGVPLPFISYGGTALVVFLTMSGLVVNISMRR